MKKQVIAIASWAMAIWMCKVFLFSIPYKFTGHPDTRHIFGTIGDWIAGILGQGTGALFASVGPYAVGSFEILTSLVLLLPAWFWLLARVGIGNGRRGPARAKFHRIGGAMAAVVMAGAVFFHLATPLGVVVLHEGESDGGSLFYAALSILILGIVMFFINGKPAR